MTPVRLQSAWEIVTGTFRTVTRAPGCPEAAVNSGGVGDRGLGGKLLHAAIFTTVRARTVIPTHTLPGRQGSLFIPVGRSKPSSGSRAVPTRTAWPIQPTIAPRLVQHLAVWARRRQSP